MPCTALPEHLQKSPLPHGDGTDHDNSIQGRWSRCWTAFGPNATEKIGWVGIPIPWTGLRIPIFPLPAKWRRFPIVLVAYNTPRLLGKNDEPEVYDWSLVNRLIFFRARFFDSPKPWSPADAQVAPSPIQKEYFSFALMWPLHFVITFTWIGMTKLHRFYFRIGARWDSFDDYYTFPAIFLGGDVN